MSNKRKGWIAFLLSLFLPGFGHFYSGHIRRAILFFLGSLLASFLSLLALQAIETSPWNVAVAVAIFLVVTVYIAVDAALVAKRIAASFVHRSYNRWYVYLSISIVWILLGDQLPPARNYEVFTVASVNMEDKLIRGDWVLVKKPAFGNLSLHPNDIAVFKFPLRQKQLWINRCIATPGDVVEIRSRETYVNGRLVNSPTTVKHTNEFRAPLLDNFGPFNVPEDKFFMLGDNRDNSYDSRHFGAVSRDLLVGEGSIVLYSPDLSRIGLHLN